MLGFFRLEERGPLGFPQVTGFVLNIHRELRKKGVVLHGPHEGKEALKCQTTQRLLFRNWVI